MLRLVLSLDGERVVDLKPDIGYSIAASEAAEHGDYVQIDRSPTGSTTSAMSNPGYVGAVESSWDRGSAARAGRARHSRSCNVASHLVWLGTHGSISGR